MDFTAIVDVAIGLSLIYLGISLYVTIVNEFIAHALQLRGKQLAADLKALIDEVGLRDRLKKTPALAPFLDGNGRGRSYIDPNVVARLLVGATRVGPTAVASMNDLVAAINSLPDSQLKVQLSALAQSVSDSTDRFLDSVSEWVDQSLTMMGEVYKRRMQLISFGIGLLAAVVFNIDTLEIASRLYRDKEARATLVALGERFAVDVSKEAFEACLATEDRTADARCKPILGLVDSIAGRNQTLGQLPMFWKDTKEAFRKLVPGWNLDWLSSWAGWLVTALAVSLGAPFWFDLLNKLVNVRHGIRRPEAKSTTV